MVAILHEADVTSVAAAATNHKVSEQSIYAWRQHLSALAPSDVKRLRTLEATLPSGACQVSKEVAFETSACGRRGRSAVAGSQRGVPAVGRIDRWAWTRVAASVDVPVVETSASTSHRTAVSCSSVRVTA